MSQGHNICQIILVADVSVCTEMRQVWSNLVQSMCCFQLGLYPWVEWEDCGVWCVCHWRAPTSQQFQTLQMVVLKCIDFCDTFPAYICSSAPKLTAGISVGRSRTKESLCVSLTILHIEGIGGQSQRGAAVVALEAAAVEELPLCAQPLHHVHALPTEEAHVAAADVDWELFSERALREDGALISVVFF